MTIVLSPPGPISLLLLLFRREVVAKLTSVWLYVVATLVCLIAFAYGSGFQSTFETETVLVTTDPLMLLNILVTVFLGLTLGMRLSASLAWEREHRTLEVLLVGPVGWELIVVAKFLVELCIFAVLIVIYWAYLLLAQPLGSGVIVVADTQAIGQMPLFALPVMALGLLVSAWARTVRGAVVIYLVVVGVLAVIEIAQGILVSTPVDQLSLAALYARAGLQAISPYVTPISAVGQLAVLVQALVAQVPLMAAGTLGSLALTLITLAVATVTARLRGAQ